MSRFTSECHIVQRKMEIKGITIKFIKYISFYLYSIFHCILSKSIISIQSHVNNFLLKARFSNDIILNHPIIFGLPVPPANEIGLKVDLSLRT